MSRLVCVDPIAGDTYETAHYRSCDLCHESACEDVWAGRLAAETWRLFYLAPDEGGLCVCEHCLLAYYAEACP